MPSFKSTVFAAAAAFVATAQADYYVDPSTVPLATRKAWCADEKTTCPIICQQVEPRTTLVNDCDPDSLTYGCICGNEKQPNMTEFSLTLPYYVCQEYGNQCVKACGLGANQCASNCRQNNPCGAQNPTRQNTTSTAGTATASATASETSNAIYTGLGDSGSSSGSSSGSGAAALEMGRSAGLAILVGSLIGGAALLL
ncbi:hypothetical protein CORC01_12657 [Colletotrichum orchidophilum]|uniref:DUF7707 domain-containing protein n=1 Tax=Colletotrichum orchidophilum TaxID=1209926 RepID=A0A1G4AS81_9PEZI|nr:uncharacterized protein CORC01_12657 [Colletotrichum orchidophilum]OHE92018.1 hypothetical protein CORC01_12657 [Colletotrichum orchidophilum]